MADPNYRPSTYVPTFSEEDDRIVSVHFFYIKEMFTLKYIYEEVLKEIQSSLPEVGKISNGGRNGEGIITELKKWTDGIQIARHSNLYK